MAALPLPKTLIRLPAAPMHRRPSRRSEQVSQGLLGDPVVPLEARGGWRRVRTWEGYEGWLLAGALAPAPVGWEGPWGEVLPRWVNLRLLPDYRAGARVVAFAGCRLPLAEERPRWIGLRLPDATVGWVERHRVRPWPGPAGVPPEPQALIATAEQFLGTPYLWGGCTALGLDCSGFVQLVWRLHGGCLPRDAWQQAGCGTCLEARDAAPADLLFFGPEEGGRERVTHVGLCLGGERMIHAAGSDQVRVDRYLVPPYRARLLFARRLPWAPAPPPGGFGDGPPGPAPPGGPAG